MPKKITFEEAQRRFQDRKDIELCEDGWMGWKTNSKFYDLVEKEHFWSLPEQVCFKKTKHPNRALKERIENKKITFEEARGRFADRDDIELVEDGWNGWTKKSKFWHKGLSEEWWSVPQNVFRQNSNHPKLAQQAREKTSVRKYGHKNPLSSEEVRGKIKKTNLKKYGHENPQQNKEIKGKKEATCLKKYGCKNPAQSKRVQEKIKKTNLKKYGNETFFQSQEFKKTVGQDCHHPLYTNRFIIETGVHLKDWLNNQPEPKPGYSTLCHVFSNEEISLKALEEYINNYKDSKTNLEVFMENLFGIKHYNKKPNEKISYRPDFRLSDCIFLNADGLYWHSEKIKKDKWYHFNLRKDFEESGLRIFQFREDQLCKEPQIVKSITSNSLKETPHRLWGRKCTIQTVSQREAGEFLKHNHLMGSTAAKHIGLFHEEKLVSLMSYKCRGSVCKIERFCSLVDHSVIGGFSKLLSCVEKECSEKEIGEVHNWVDLRYGTGDHLLDKGFEFKKETLGWKWTDFKTTYNRLRCRANMDKRQMSERDHAEELGWFKIYDAGQRLYVKLL